MKQHFTTIRFDNQEVIPQIVARTADGILDDFLKRYQKVSTYEKSLKSLVASREMRSPL